MRKALCVVLIISLCICSFPGCSEKERQVVELTNDNYWQYLNVSEGNDFAEANSETALSGSIRGVLDYAYYEDVVLIYEVAYRADHSDWENAKRYEVKVTLNAAGDADFEVTYNGIAVPVNGVGYADSETVNELYGYYRNLFFKSVSGKVIYTV